MSKCLLVVGTKQWRCCTNFWIALHIVPVTSWPPSPRSTTYAGPRRLRRHRARCRRPGRILRPSCNLGGIGTWSCRRAFRTGLDLGPIADWGPLGAPLCSGTKVPRRTSGGGCQAESVEVCDDAFPLARLREDDPAPASSARVKAGWLSPVLTTILMGRRAASMIVRISTSPEISGRPRSLTTTSKCRLRKIANASCPLPAAATSAPSIRSSMVSTPSTRARLRSRGSVGPSIP